MLINDVDIQARWRVRAKDEWIAAQGEGRPFVNPLEPKTLRWRKLRRPMTERKDGSQPGRALAIKPDATWPGMWRVKLPNGALTDMVNLTRAPARWGGLLSQNRSQSALCLLHRLPNQMSSVAVLR
jgi:hypothetical protein